MNGSFNMIFLRHRISSAYRKDDDPTVLINGNFDSPSGSPGADDCGSCVAPMLEVLCLIIDSGWVPPHPIVFLLNGGVDFLC